jgi:hypothetical protein
MPMAARCRNEVFGLYLPADSLTLQVIKDELMAES